MNSLIETNIQEVFTMLYELDFKKDIYKLYPLRHIGRADLLPAVRSYTRKCLNKVGQHFQQCYIVAQSGWCSKPHIDSTNMKLHGLKIHIPINVDSYIGYVYCDKYIRIYKLTKGIPHFVNTSVPHFGINPLKKERVTLIFQLASDKDILKGIEITPEKNNKPFLKKIPWIKELYANYDQNYKILSKQTSTHEKIEFPRFTGGIYKKE